MKQRPSPAQQQATKRAILYLRVSSTKQADQGESLEDQEAACRRFAQRRKLTVDAVFREPYSGRNDRRPELKRLFAYLDDSPGQVDAVIIRVIDRFSRGGAYFYESLKQRLQERSIELLDTADVIQPVQNALEEPALSTTGPSFFPAAQCRERCQMR